MQADGKTSKPSRSKLYKSAFLTAITNPKATMFFTALFPQFIDQSAALLPQFLLLTSIFAGLSLVSLSLYAAIAAQAKGVLKRPAFFRVDQQARWLDVHRLRCGHSGDAAAGCLGRLHVCPAPTC
nr:hypothetical protein GCM10020185_84930 [Pseudomonas brassicacearum subsp. brassicacearum]